MSVLEVAANPWYEPKKVFDHLEIVAEPVELAQATLHRADPRWQQNLLRELGRAVGPTQILLRQDGIR